MADVYEIAEGWLARSHPDDDEPCECPACTFARALLAQKAVVDAAVAAYKARQSFWERDEDAREGGDLAEMSLYEHMENEAISAYVRAMKEQTR